MARSRPCIQCGKCLEVCPLLRATGREELGPRAKALLAELADAVERGESDISVKNVAELAGLCLGCHRCEAVCSQGVRPAAAVARLRAGHPGWRNWLWKRWMETPRMWRLAGGAAHLVPGGEAQGAGPTGSDRLRRAATLLRGLGESPRITPFLAVGEIDKKLQKEQVVVFHGCVSSYVARNRRQAAENLLRAAGAQLADAGFQCCGAPLATAGCVAEAAALRAGNVAAWRAAGRPRIALYCASCRHGLAAYADVENGGLFADEAERCKWLDSLTPISALLMDARFVVLENAPAGVAYHRPCHAAAPDTDAALLARILGGRFRELSKDACCGFGGVLQLGAPELAARVAEDLWTGARTSARLMPGDAVLTGCSACAVQLAATAPGGVAAAHWLDALVRD